MSIEVLKEKINIELERFKIYVLVTVALGGGVSGLLLNYDDNNNFYFKLVLVTGLIFFLIFLFASIYSHLKIGKFSNKL